MLGPMCLFAFCQNFEPTISQWLGPFWHGSPKRTFFRWILQHLVRRLFWILSASRRGLVMRSLVIVGTSLPILVLDDMSSIARQDTIAQKSAFSSGSFKVLGCRGVKIDGHVEARLSQRCGLGKATAMGREAMAMADTRWCGIPWWCSAPAGLHVLFFFFSIFETVLDDYIKRFVQSGEYDGVPKHVPNRIGSVGFQSLGLGLVRRFHARNRAGTLEPCCWVAKLGWFIFFDMFNFNLDFHNLSPYLYSGLMSVSFQSTAVCLLQLCCRYRSWIKCINTAEGYQYLCMFVGYIPIQGTGPVLFLWQSHFHVQHWFKDDDGLWQRSR